MERKKLFYWSAQVAGWGAYFILSVLLLFSTQEILLTTNLFLYILSSIAVSILISHSVRYVMLKRQLVQQKIAAIIIWTLGLSLIGAILLETSQYLLTEYAIAVDFVEGVEPDSDQPIDWANFSFAVFRSVLLFLIWTGAYLTFLFIEKSRQQEIQRLKLDASANEIELKNLRAQLNPHFLFNSLNSIRALVGLNPDLAKSAITQLSNLLRHSINLGKQQEISLEDEMEIVKSYLDLEKIRFEERLRIQYNISDDCRKCRIPPLMIQTIVENSIKHGISKSIDGGDLILQANLNGKQLTFDVINTGQLDEKEAHSGLGIANTKKRLDILYGEKGSFAIIQDADRVRATIKIEYT